MSRVITFDKGSKRRIKRIRWSTREAVSIVFLSLVITLLGALLAVWEVDHYREESRYPHVKAHH
jgi:preprotein translocase subunit SecE